MRSPWSKKRRQYSAEFKAQAELDTLQGIEPIHAIAARRGVRPLQVCQWKKKVAERLLEVFADSPPVLGASLVGRGSTRFRSLSR